MTVKDYVLVYNPWSDLNVHSTANRQCVNMKFLLFLFGIVLGVVFSQLSTKCGDGNVCFCSQSSKTVTCVDVNIMRVPTFSTYVRQWVKRLNLRFNGITDLGRILNEDFPRLELIDVRNNDNYLCGDIHRLILTRGIIIESHCPSEEQLTIPAFHSTTSMTPTTRSTTTPTPTPVDTTEGNEESNPEVTTGVTTTERSGKKITSFNVTATFDLGGKIGCECECNISFAVSISALVSSTFTTILGICIHYLCKRLRQKYNLPQLNVTARFDQERPRNVRPAVTLFDDISQRPSTSGTAKKKPIYTGPPRPDISVINPNYSIESSSDEDDGSGHYEVPIYQQNTIPKQPRNVLLHPTVPPPPPPPPSRGLLTLPRRSNSDIPQPGSQQRPVIPNRPGSAPSTSSTRGRARGRGKAAKKPSDTTYVNVDPPARNTRSQRNLMVTNHM